MLQATTSCSYVHAHQRTVSSQKSLEWHWSLKEELAQRRMGKDSADGARAWQQYVRERLRTTISYCWRTTNHWSTRGDDGRLRSHSWVRSTLQTYYDQHDLDNWPVAATQDLKEAKENREDCCTSELTLATTGGYLESPTKREFSEWARECSTTRSWS